MCRALLPTWSGVSDARLEPIAGGITNALHKVVPETADRDGPEPVVLRVFGRGTERFLDRETETAALAELNAFGFGAACLGVFTNGRLEAFLADARPLTIQEMAAPSVARAVAQTLRRLHACDVRARRGVVSFAFASKNASASASASEPTTRGTLESSREKPASQTWDIMRSWLDGATLDLEPGGMHPKLEALELTALRRDVDFLETATTRKTSAPTVLLHNDALAGNVMVPTRFRASGTASTLDLFPDVTLIDFEYSCYGPRGFDLANHLIEHAGFECDWRRLPSRAFRRDFCAAYLGDEAADEAAVTKLLLETEAFYPVSHLWWGAWAAMQARTEKAIEFDYAAYAEKRLDEFRRLRRFAFGEEEDALVSGTTDDDDADLLGPRLPG